jgi:LPS export ABC transporter protein LptC
MVRQAEVLLIHSLRTGGFLSVTALWIVSSVVFPGCGSDIATGEVQVDSTRKAMMSATEFEVLFSDSGRLQARLTGPKVYRYSGEDSWLEFPDGFRVEMFDSVQRLETTIRAEYGRRDDPSRIMEARKNVVVRNELKSEQLNTEILIWDDNKHTIHTDEPVKITTPGKILFGDGLVSNESFTNYTILRPRGEMSIKKDSI